MGGTRYYQSLQLVFKKISGIAELKTKNCTFSEHWKIAIVIRKSSHYYSHFYLFIEDLFIKLILLFLNIKTTFQMNCQGLTMFFRTTSLLSTTDNKVVRVRCS